MAKQKSGKAKTKGHKLPKTVAGIKIPKPLRKQGEHLLELASQPLVKELMAAAAIALVTKMRESDSARRAPAKANPPEPDSTAPATPVTPPAAARSARAPRARATPPKTVN